MSYLIKDLTFEEKPREKAKKYGIENLTDLDLLAIVLRSGSKSCSVLDLAREILKNYHGLDGLANARMSSLKKIFGMGEVKALTLLASLELGKRCNRKQEEEMVQIKESKDVFEYFQNVFRHESQEKFYVLYLDSQNYVLERKLLFMGTSNQSLVHPRDIFREAVLLNAVKIICVHNHPSGRILPSKADIEITKKLKKIGEMMGISLIDHVIVGASSYFSFLERYGGNLG